MSTGLSKHTKKIVYPETDDKPLPDGEYQAPIYREIVGTLQTHFSNRPEVHVNGNTMFYYEEGNLNARVAPDCFALLGGNVASLWSNNRYLMWEVGKAPDFVLEIGSPSTAQNDLGPKRDLYARLGVAEYWMFDPSGGEHYGFPLRGERLADGEYRGLDMREETDGEIWGHSPTLNLDLHWREGRLRFYDPVAARWLENMEETGMARDAAEARARAAEAELRRLRAEN